MTYTMHRRADQALVGSCGFKDAPRQGRVEIGYGVAPDCRNQGVATAAVAALLDLAFSSGDVHQVLAQIDPDNRSSTRVVEKLGFRAEGTRTAEHDEVLVQWVATRSARAPFTR